jgi:hypothetical protein
VDPRTEYLSMLNPGELAAIYGASLLPGFHYLVMQIFFEDIFDWTVGIASVNDNNPQSATGSLLVRPVPVPESGTAILLGGGLLALASRTSRRRRGPARDCRKGRPHPDAEHLSHAGACNAGVQHPVP